MLLVYKYNQEGVLGDHSYLGYLFLGRWLSTFLWVVERLEFARKCDTGDGHCKGIAQLVAVVREDQEPCRQA